MHWNFRLIQHEKGKKAWFGIHEVFYNEKGKANGCTKDPIDITSESPEGVKWMINKIRSGLKKPILKYEAFEKMEKKHKK